MVKLRIGRPLIAAIAFGSLVVSAVPVAAAAYTRDSVNPLAWRNLSLYEIQGKLDYCLKEPMPSAVLGCDYGRVSETGGLEPRRAKVKQIVILKPYPVAGPVIVDGAGLAAPGSESTDTASPAKGSNGEHDGRTSEDRKRAALPTPTAGNFPLINFPPGPMSAIEAACESAQKAAAGQSQAYRQNVAKQCAAAEEAYERAHP
jgi:hypothetical protein